MIALSAMTVTPSPPLVPADPVLDLEHLVRMTLNDRSLEREVLALFERQSELLLTRIRENEGGAAAAAHTLKGSARGIGAFTVALMAEAVEQADAGTRSARIGALDAAVGEARAAIAERLRSR